MNLTNHNGQLLLESEFTTGNKAWLARIDGLDPRFTFTRTFLNRTRSGLKMDAVEEGQIFEEVVYSHSGKNPRKTFFQIKNGEMVSMGERDVILQFK